MLLKAARLIMLVFLSLVFASTFAVTDNIADGVEAGQVFYFIAVSLIVLILFAFTLLLKRGNIKVKLNLIDVSFIALWAYIFIRSVFTQSFSFYNPKLIVYTFLVFLYFIFKNVLQKDNKSNALNLFLFIIIFIGTLQAVYGNLQLHGFYVSNHNLFKITGSFFNPGPYSGYLASVFPLALGFVLFFDTNNLQCKFIRYLSFAFLFASLLIIVPAGSRAAWLAIVGSSFVLLAIKFHSFGKLKKHLNTPIKKGALAAFVLIVIFAGAVALYQIKPGSVNGRLFIWKLSSKMIAEKPLFGTGFDRFTVDFNNYQASYFARQDKNGGIDEEEAMIAGTGEYAFNEYIQFAVEAGIIGLLLFITLVLLAIWQIFKKPTDKYVVLSGAGMVSVLIFALFSYPFAIVPIAVNFIFFIAVISSKIYQPFYVKPFIKENFSISKLVQVPVAATLLVIAVFGGVKLQIQFEAYCQWKTAQTNLQFGMYEASANEIKEIAPFLYWHPLFMHQYGNVMVLVGKNKFGITILKRATAICSDPYFYNNLGNAYKKVMSYTKAEEAFKHASFMVPHKVYSKYLLAGLYSECGQTDKAQTMAMSILNMKIKVQSKAIEQIKIEMKNILKIN